MKDKETIGVIFLNLGGPDSLHSVKPFLYNIFSDRQIIQLGPAFLQKPIAWLISTVSSKKAEKHYSLIGGKSPILEITTAQAKALEELLNKQAISNQQSANNPSRTFRIYVGMRYWHPFIEDALSQIHKDGVRKLIALGLYPQYSAATSGSSLSRLKEVALKYPIEVFCAPPWFNHPIYIDALVDVIKKGIDSFNHPSPITHYPSAPDVHVLFSAHSLPQKFIDEGDPYVHQIMGTIEEIIKHMTIKWHLSYQSKSGPVNWLEPSTEEKLKELAVEGIKNILVVPISFISDHIETLYEIDILYKQMAEGLGINLKRTEALNTHPLFIKALRDIVLENVKEIGWM